MLCVTETQTYTCSDASGTTCTKLAVRLPVITTQTTCNSNQYVLLTKAETEIPAPSPERLAEIGEVFVLLLVALLVVWGSKQLLKLFTDDTEK